MRYEVTYCGQGDFQVIDNEIDAEVCSVCNYESHKPDGTWFERADAEVMASLIAKLLNDNYMLSLVMECTCPPMLREGQEVCSACKAIAVQKYGDKIPIEGEL